MRRSRFWVYLCVLILLVIHFGLFINRGMCLVSNSGFAFGFLENIPFNISIVISCFFLCSLLLSLYLLNTKKIWLGTCIALLAVGNTIDRAVNGVCDYIEIFAFPSFNLLDLGIVLILGYLIIDIIKYGKNKDRQ